MKIKLFYLENLEERLAHSKRSMLAAAVLIISVNRRGSCHGSRETWWWRAWALGSDRAQFKSSAPSWVSHETPDKLLTLSKAPLSHLSGEYNITIPIFSGVLRRCRAHRTWHKRALSNRNLCSLLNHTQKSFL